MTSEHQQRKEDNRWTADQVKEIMESRIKEMDLRYQQRWDAQEEALKKVNEIRDVINDVRKDTMLRQEVETRFGSMLELIRETQKGAERQTDQHFAANRAKIENNDNRISELQKQVVELITNSKSQETGSHRVWEKAAVVVSMLIAIAALVSAFWKH